MNNRSGGSIKGDALGIPTERGQFDPEPAAPLFLRSDAKQEARDLILEHHYSHAWPNAPTFIVTWHEFGGLFGDRGPAVAAVTFSPSGGWAETTMELSRLVRVPSLKAPLTSLIGSAVRELRRKSLDSLVLSYADPEAGHYGGIYQAGSWFYAGLYGHKKRRWVIDGIELHEREVWDRYGTNKLDMVVAALGSESRLVIRTPAPKHLYWRPLNRSGKAKARRLGLRSIPYPKPDAEPTKPGQAGLFENGGG